MKNLYASPVGKHGKDFLRKIIGRFGYEHFDFLIFVYDDAAFDEEVFQGCKFIHEQGLHTYFFKKYLTPQYCEGYEYIFPWMDDIDIDDFSVWHFLDIMKANDLELAQPAMSDRSKIAHPITSKHQTAVGRFTDFVEVMVQVFRKDAWDKYWELLEEDRNPYGWGYDFVCKKVCGFERVGIIDCETVTHTRRSSGSERDFQELKRLLSKYNVGMDIVQRQERYVELKDPKKSLTHLCIPSYTPPA